MHAFVLDRNRKPLTPCRMARARILLQRGQAAVFRRYPFTIILKERGHTSAGRAHRIKIDPGSRTTGIAIVQEKTGRVVAALEIAHRGQAIKVSLEKRRAIRRGRRTRQTRYRQPRFDNRTRREGWLPPSLESRVASPLTWVGRLRRLCPITAVSQELVKFDLQKEENPEIAGIEYQQGTLAGYEVREYLLEKWHRQCCYCGKAGVPLQIEHIVARSRGGTDRITNLALACAACNDRKGNQPVAVFLKKKPEVLEGITRQARAPLKDATAVNATRWELFHRLQATGLPIELGSGGRTKYNRTMRELPKTHWLDAACVGASTPERFDVAGVRPLLVKARGHGKRNRCWTNRHGFPVRHAPRKKLDRGFRTGDIVVADVPAGKHQGCHIGRVTIRFGQNFQVGPASIHPRHLQVIHRADGYDYLFGERFDQSTSKDAAPPDP